MSFPKNQFKTLTEFKDNYIYILIVSRKLMKQRCNHLGVLKIFQIQNFKLDYLFKHTRMI
jgi:hypothetical protein